MPYRAHTAKMVALEISTLRTDHDLYDLFPLPLCRYFKADLFPILYISCISCGRVGPVLHDLSIVARISWVGSVLYRSCTTSHNGRIGSVDDLDRDLSWIRTAHARFSHAIYLRCTLVTHNTCRCIGARCFKKTRDTHCSKMNTAVSHDICWIT